MRLIVPDGISVSTSGGTVFLSGDFDGDVGTLIQEVAEVDGALLVVADEVHPSQPTATPTSPFPKVLGQPSFLLSVSRDSIELTGTLSSLELVEEVELAACRVFASRRVRSRLEAGLVEEASWVLGPPSAREAALDAAVGSFELDIKRDGAAVSGIAPDQESADMLLADLTSALGFEPVSSFEIRDLSAQLTALLRGVTTFETGLA